jgi:uncharacterized protein (TIGR02678 family)
MKAVAPLVTVHPSPEIEAERRQALRVLLRNPLLLSSGETAEGHALVRRHSVWLKQWLTTFPGWTLHIDAEVVRLRKTPPDLSDGTRPAIDATSGSPFSRRRYALLCLALLALERSERQTTLGKIAEMIMDVVAADKNLQAAGMVFDISSHDQRRDLVHAVRFLLNRGLLRKVDGDEQEFLNRTGSSDALYEINRATLAVMLNVARSPVALEAAAQATPDASVSVLRSTVERGTRIIEDPPPATEEARSRRIRARLVRILLDEPVLYFRDLNSEELAYLERERGYLLRQIREAAGLIPEIRREGIAMLDDAGDLTDVKLPEKGTDGEVALLLAEWLAEHLRTNPGTAVTIQSVQQQVAKLIKAHGSRWRKSVHERGAEMRVAEDALLRLQGLRLVEMTPEGVVPLAANGRYARVHSFDDTRKRK